MFAGVVVVVDLLVVVALVVVVTVATQQPARASDLLFSALHTSNKQSLCM